MNPKPTKNEILEKYRSVIDDEHFEILYEESLPTPEETHQDNASLQYLGTLGGWYVWAFWKMVGNYSPLLSISNVIPFPS